MADHRSCLNSIPRTRGPAVARLMRANEEFSMSFFIRGISSDPKAFQRDLDRPFATRLPHRVSNMADVSPSSAQPPFLRFACSCASATTPPADPWAPLVQQGKLRDGTKERILNALHDPHCTIAHLAERLDLSQPTIHRHITDLLASELIREEPVPPDERAWAVERYYRPNFPVIAATDRAAVAALLDTLADAFAAAFQGSIGSLNAAMARTDQPAREEERAAVLHYLYTTAARLGRAK